MRKALAFVLALAMAVSLVACGNSNSNSTPSDSGTPASDSNEVNTGGNDGTVYTLRCSTNLASTSTVGQGLAKFVELINEKSGGRINATANYGSELGSQAEQVSMAKLGDLEMVVAAPGTGPGAYAGCEPLLLFEFPFLFEDNDQYRRVLKAVEPQVNEMVAPIGFTAMGGQSQGARDILTTVPVNSLDDMKDLIMRGPNAVYISMFESLGAAGITMDWNDIYTALQNNTCNGCEGSPSSLHASALEDNAKYLAITNHIIACVYYFFSTEWLEALPADLQTIVKDCVSEAVAYQEELDDADQDVALQAMIDAGVTVTEIQDISDWKNACTAMTDEYLAKGDNWQSFYQALTSVS